MEEFPVKNQKRARRRADMQRMKSKAKRIARSKVHMGYNEEDVTKWVKLADHLKCCDCWMCSNPRKALNEKTLQEYRADDNFKQQLSDPDSIIEDEVDALITYKLDKYYHGSKITF